MTGSGIGLLARIGKALLACFRAPRRTGNLAEAPALRSEVDAAAVRRFAEALEGTIAAAASPPVPTEDAGAAERFARALEDAVRSASAEPAVVATETASPDASAKAPRHAALRLRLRIAARRRNKPAAPARTSKPGKPKAASKGRQKPRINRPVERIAGAGKPKAKRVVRRVVWQASRPLSVAEQPAKPANVVPLRIDASQPAGRPVRRTAAAAPVRLQKAA